jgi:2-methylcitrate dehydratase PrpD
MSVTKQLAEWVVRTRYEDVPAKGMQTVRQSVLDWFGCALVASDSTAAKIVAGFLEEQGGTPQARVVGSGLRSTSMNAAFANGVLGHVEDYDDSGAHPSSYLVPTVMALGEERKLSGSDVLAAWAVGYDVSTRLGVGLRMDRAWHPTAIYGTMGATAAASKLLGLDVHQTRMAFGIAASQAGGVSRNFGTMTKSFHPGNSARSAIMAAKLAARGFTADPDIIEGRDGYADCFGGEKCYPPGMVQFLGDVSVITSKGPAVKVWPCCSGNHQTITGILEIIEKAPLDPARISRVDHYSAEPPGTAPLLRNVVKQGLDGKFCLEYNIAATLIDRKVDRSTFSDDRVSRGDLQAFMKRVFRHQHPEAALASGRVRDGMEVASIRIVMEGGTVHEKKLGPRRTLTGAAVVDKFRANAAPVLDAARIDRALELITGLEKVSDVTQVMDAVTR